MSPVDDERIYIIPTCATLQSYRGIPFHIALLPHRPGVKVYFHCVIEDFLSPSVEEAIQEARRRIDLKNYTEKRLKDEGEN